MQYGPPKYSAAYNRGTAACHEGGSGSPKSDPMSSLAWAAGHAAFPS